MKWYKMEVLIIILVVNNYIDFDGKVNHPVKWSLIREIYSPINSIFLNLLNKWIFGKKMVNE